MGDCCHNKANETDRLAKRHRHVLVAVLVINLVMFAIELASGLMADSLALVGDSLDMLGDAVTYAGSLWVVGLGVSAKAQVARLKAGIMLTFGLIISGRALWRALSPEVPEFGVMLGIGALALVANLGCLFLLTQHREDDINMRSVWICSRNDIVANTAVLGAALLVAVWQTPWPDVVVGLGLALLFTKSASTIFRDAASATAAEKRAAETR